MWATVVSRGNGANGYGPPEPEEPATPHTRQTAWLALSIALQLVAGPAILFLGDALARQMLPASQ